MQKPERSMKRPLRRKSNLERRRMIATETVASKIGGASPGRLRHRAVKKRNPPGPTQQPGASSYFVTCQPGLGIDGGGRMPGWPSETWGPLERLLPRRTPRRRLDVGAGGLVEATCHGMGKFGV